MRHDKATEDIRETAALYALGALSQHEARAFESHLGDGCPVCANELSRHELVVGRLGLAADESDPPTYLGELLAARLEREPGPPEKGTATASDESPPLPALEPKIRHSRLVYLPWAVAASFAILAALSYFSLRQVRSEIDRQDERLNLLQNESERLNGVLEQERARSGELEQIRTALRSRGTRMFLLAGQAAAPTASAAVFWETDRQRWLVTAELPVAAEGKQYQLWFVTPSSKISAGLMETDGSGHGFLVVDLPEGLVQIKSAAITLEPEGGSAQPSLPIYALGVVG